MTKNQNLGRTLIRDHKKKRTFVKDGFRHTSDLPDGLDWARLNLRSVTEQNSVDDFLGKAELAEAEYNEEFGNVKIINSGEDILLSQEEIVLTTAAQDLNKHILSVPRRPKWSINTTKEELDGLERAEFLNWRRKLAKLSEEEYITLTPYEKNLEVWRQLWRVIERSDVLVQILDARNPLLFRCEDLEKYVEEVGDKQNILLLNKADFLTEEQRKFWAQYFQDIGVKVIFFSALQQSQKVSEITEDEDGNLAEDSDVDSSEDDVEDSTEDGLGDSTKSIKKNVKESDGNSETNIKENFPDVSDEHVEDSEDLQENANSGSYEERKSQSSELDATVDVDLESSVLNSSKVYSREELVDYFKEFKVTGSTSNTVTVGLVGYPNVGKSSTINALLQTKKVQVSATPGKTKHFQTFMIDPSLCLCDCPGLVFPNFVSSKAEMVINGILPIDHLNDHYPPMSLIAKLIPKHVLETTYSIIIPFQDERHPDNITAEDLLNAYGYMRGFMSQRGLPDGARSSRYILKDFVNGKILYCHSPPGVDDVEYQQYTIRPVKQELSVVTKNPKSSKEAITSNVVDKNFFKKVTGQAHVKGNISHAHGSNTTTTNETSKPWKKHNNRNKKEKLRRVYRTSDY